MILKMATYEPMAMYEEVVRIELAKHIFANEKEINDTIKYLISQGILADKVGILKDKEMNYLLKFGDIQSKNKRVLTFARKELNQDMVHLRLKLYERFLYPK
jgi:hypothetical protein